MAHSSLDDLGKLILRLALGILMLFHGVAKLRWGVDSIETMMTVRGLPAMLAWGVYLGEVLAPVLVILVIYSRLGGLLIFLNMVVAIFLLHFDAFLRLYNVGWRLELQAMYLCAVLAVAMIVVGRYSLGGSGGRGN